MNHPANRPPSHLFEERSHPCWFDTSRASRKCQFRKAETKLRNNDQRGEAILSTNRPNAASGTGHQIDWLATAIVNMGGIASAAKKLKVSQKTVTNWFDYGLAKATLGTATAISKNGNVSIECLMHPEYLYGRRNQTLDRRRISDRPMGRRV
jgi:hypothetical protein